MFPQFASQAAMPCDRTESGPIMWHWHTSALGDWCKPGYLLPTLAASIYFLPPSLHSFLPSSLFAFVFLYFKKGFLCVSLVDLEVIL